jgi:hypothetical protein
MSLDWDSTKCSPPLPQTDDEKHDRNTLVWGAMAVDLGRITDSNVEEWVFRLFYQRDAGLDYISLGELKPSEVRAMVNRWIGLRTNVLTLTRKQWVKKCADLMERRTMELVRVEEEQPA